MQKKVIFGTVAIASIVAVSGFFAGRQSVTHQVPTIGGTVSSTTQVKIVGQPTKIAVVNQDQGAVNYDETVNCGAEVIKTLDDNYVVTSREAAKKGLQNGTYAAMVVLPGNFSNNALSIMGKQPTKIEVYYELNKELDATANAVTRGVLQNFQSNLNTKFSVMYIQAIIGEVHKGQEYVEQIFNNDTKDLEAISSINNIELLKGINLTDLEDQNVQIENIDLTKNFEENKEIMNQIDDVYKSKIAINDAKLTALKSDIATLVNDENSGLKAIQSKLSKLTTQELIDALAKSHEYDYDKLKELYNVNVEDVDNYIKNSLSGSTDSVQEKAKTAITEIDTLLEDNEKAANAIKKYASVSGESNTTTPSKDTVSPSTSNNSSLPEEYLLYGEITKELIKSNPTLFDELYTKVSTGNTVTYNKILKNITGTNTADNLFKDSAELKTYLIEKSAGTTDFILERNKEYSSLLQSNTTTDNSTTNNGTATDSTTDNKDNGNKLDKIKEEAEKINTSAEKVKSSESYKYLKDLFDEKSDNSLANVVENSTKGAKKEELLNKIKENNKTIIDSTKTLVESQIQTDGVVNITSLMGMLDQDYIAKFEGIIGKAENAGTVGTVGTVGNTTVPVSNEDAKIIDLWMQYDLMNKNITSTLSTELTKYSEAVTNSKDNANKHIQSMREYLDKGIEEAQKNIDSTLEKVQESKIQTTKSNRESLNSLSSLLNNTKIGTAQNTNLYTFIANPINLQENKTLGSGAAKNAVVTDYNDTFRFVTLGAVFAAILCVALKSRKKLKKQAK